MKKYDMFHMKSRVLRVLVCVLLCVAVSVCGRENNIRNIEDWSDIGANDIVAIMVRGQIFFLCPPCRPDEKYDDALAEWKAMNYGASYQLFMEAKERIKKRFADDNYEMAAVDNALGCLCLDMGKYEEGYEYLNSAYVTMKNLYGESSVPVLAILSNITYYDYAAGKLEQCLEDAHSVVSAAPPLYIWIVTNHIQMLVSYELGEYTYAIRGSYILIDSFMKEQDENFEWQDMLSLQDYLSHQERERFDMFIYRSLAMISLNIANSYAMLTGNEEGKTEAEKWYEASLFICQNRLGEDAKGLLARVNIDYAYFLPQCEETEKAFSLMENTMDIQENFGDSEEFCIDLAESYRYYGDMLMFIKNDQKAALKYYEKARDLSESVYGLYHIQTARTYFNLGKYYAVLNQDEKALENLKRCEGIKRNIGILKDDDAVSLYLYLAAIYKRQEKFDLADEYKDRAKMVSEYLHYVIMSAPATQNTTGFSEEDERAVLDLTKYNAGAEWQAVIDNYISAVQNCDANALMDSLQLEFVELLPVILDRELEMELENEKVLSSYKDFYQEELMALREELTVRYGDEYSIRFEAYAVERFSSTVINEANDFLFSKYDSEITIEDGVMIKGQFWVDGTSDSVSGQEGNGFLYHDLIMLKSGRQWKLGISEGFPRMSQDRLRETFEIE